MADAFIRINARYLPHSTTVPKQGVSMCCRIPCSGRHGPGDAVVSAGADDEITIIPHAKQAGKIQGNSACYVVQGAAGNGTAGERASRAECIAETRRRRIKTDRSAIPIKGSLGHKGHKLMQVNWRLPSRYIHPRDWYWDQCS